MSPPRALLAALLLCQLLSYGGHQGLTKIFYTLPDTGQPPILISLGDNAKLDLKNPDELLFVNDSEQHNDTKTFTIVDSSEASDEGKDEREPSEPRLVVKAKPMHETRLTEDAFQTTTPPPTEPETESHEAEKQVNIPVKPETPQEDIPSFSEWAQKQLAEAEKKDTVLNHSSQPSHSNTNFSSKSTKRSKNYASLACGAKVVAVNPEAGSPSSILSPNRDEYMLNTCNSRIWFVVELCEAVQAQKIEIANFELFSSTPKDIAVYFSDRFPTRDWASVGQFTAQEMRDVQSFDLFPHLFGKFIKVEMLSHHGSEHYCPISLFKVYGTSEFEVLEKESSQHSTPIDEDEDDEIIDVPDIPATESEPSKNLFGSARDAVMSIMKKAAQALVKTEVPNRNVSSEHNDTSTDKMYKRCCSPSHIIVCDNCSETLYNEVYELISCSSDKLTSLVRQVFLRETLKCTGICQRYGLDFKSTKTIEFSSERVAYMNALFPPQYLAALCNMLAIKEKKVVLNTSFESENVTTNITVDETPQKINSETSSDQDVKLVPDKNNASTDDKIIESVPTEPTSSEQTLETGNSVPIDVPHEEKEKVDDKKEETLNIIEEKPVQEQQEDNKPISEAEKPSEPTVEQETKDATPKTDIKNNKVELPVEKPKENSNGGEENDQIIIDNDSFMSDFDQMAVDPTPAGKEASPNQNQAQTTFQKESVFLRLSNRVKTLERNMSLSGQYLEELSRRYKKQVEEMQKTFEKTVLQMTEERRKSNEREQKYLEQMANLQDQLTQMATLLKILMDERDSWFGNMTFFKFVMFQIILVAAVFYYVSKRRRPEPIMVPITKKSKKKQDKLRRKSVEGVSGHETPSAKKRRPSEEALQIARQSAEEEISREEDEGEWQIARKNRRRKTSIIHRNMDKVEWMRQDSIGKLQENPIPLDEEEFFAPVSEPVEFNGTIEPKIEVPKSNGSFFNNLKSKTMKTRRLSSPAFLRTLSRQSTRSNPSPVVRTLEPIFNGKLSRKAASESPTGSLWSDSTEISQNGQNESESGGNKKKKSLKNILKKVF
ncbi:SUN domain-containing ossification factor isoform X2 [Pectinophora gossypiella]|uniref:SUN domain-containing ossification factor isoform X2 n=1 Tax=Pectinophora gossypiella TaxID=13191 RepID=UPI00214DFB30|nr:SUN domain-containing ossification factor isoform X2 [Pectinophora gossypiella]XP_049870637.1 SUN domain-containing ossification factor isoform X2 [Pectinophora gossypiella]